MRVVPFYLLALCSLLAASAPAGPGAAGGSGLATLEEPESNLNLITRAVRPSTLNADSILEKRGRGTSKPKPKKSPKSKGKSSGKNSKDNKGTVSDGLDKIDELIKAAASKRGVKLIPNQDYMFREDVGSKSWLVVVKVPRPSKRTPSDHFKVVTAARLKTYEDYDVGQSKCARLFGKKECSKHDFSYFSCDTAETTHTISKKARLFSFNEDDSKYGKDMFTYKIASETAMYDKCVKQFKHPRNTARQDDLWYEEYPGDWAHARGY